MQVVTRKNFDARNYSKSRVTESRERVLNQAAKDVSESLPGNWTITVRGMDHTTNNAYELISESAPTDVKGNYVQRALAFLNVTKSAQGFENNQVAEFKPDPFVQRTSADAKAVHVQQTMAGIPVFQAGLTVRFDPNDAIEGSVGNTITVDEVPEVSPKLTAAEALIVAAKYLEEPDGDRQEVHDQFGEPLSSP